MSGAATTASMLGQPDLAIATQNDFVQVALILRDQGLNPLIQVITIECEYDCRLEPSSPLDL